MHLFYTPDISGNPYSLDEEESRHCRNVLRLRENDLIHLADGKGTLYEARITGIRGKFVSTEITGRQENYGKRQYRLHLAVAPTKNIDRFEWFLEKATEIGVDEITPVICEHSERRHLRTGRLEKVITAAMKQSLKAYHPRLNEPAPLEKFLAYDHPGNKFMAFVTPGVPLLQQVYRAGNDAVVLIGPEGDFSPAEVEKAVGSNYQVVSLGPSRLRTETAAVVACHAISILNSQF